MEWLETWPAKRRGRTAQARLGPDLPVPGKRGLKRLKTEVLSRIGADKKALQEGHGYMTLVDWLVQRKKA
jgi:hypothetical protein